MEPGPDDARRAVFALLMNELAACALTARWVSWNLRGPTGPYASPHVVRWSGVLLDAADRLAALFSERTGAASLHPASSHVDEGAARIRDGLAGLELIVTHAERTGARVAELVDAPELTDEDRDLLLRVCRSIEAELLTLEHAIRQMRNR